MRRIRQATPPSVKRLVRATRASGVSRYTKDLLSGACFVVAGRRSDAQRAVHRPLTLPQCLALTNKWFPGSLTQDPKELAEFVALLVDLEPRSLVELGSATSAHAFTLSHLVPSLQSYVGVDFHPRNGVQLRALSRKGTKVSLISADSHSIGTVESVAKALGEPADVLYVDGDHSYNGAFLDFFMYRGLVKAGGLIAFHDIVPDSRLRQGLPIVGAYSGEVPLFWQSIKRHYEHREFVTDPTQDGLGIGVLFQSAAACVAPVDLLPF